MRVGVPEEGWGGVLYGCMLVLLSTPFAYGLKLLTPLRNPSVVVVVPLVRVKYHVCSFYH